MRSSIHIPLSSTYVLPSDEVNARALRDSALVGFCGFKYVDALTGFMVSMMNAVIAI